MDSAEKHAIRLYHELISLGCLGREKLAVALEQYVGSQNKNGEIGEDPTLEQNSGNIREPILDFVRWLSSHDYLSAEEAQGIQEKIDATGGKTMYPALSAALSNHATISMPEDWHPAEKPRQSHEETAALDENARILDVKDIEKLTGKRFRLQNKIGEGAMGLVYKAYDSLLERTVALKFPRLAGGEIGRFLQEAKAATRLRHPNIVGVYDIQEHDGQYFLVMDFVEGVTLKDLLIQQGRSGPEQAIDLVSKIATAIDYANNQGIVHRDLKPANIMVDNRGEPLVMDFGIAKILGQDHTMTAASIGTPAYMSPEQASGNSKDVDKRSDVYSLGVLLYELLTGRPPFTGNNVLATLYQIVHEAPVPPTKLAPETPAEMERICLKLLEKERGMRYQSAAEMVEDLRRLVAIPKESEADPAKQAAKKRFKLERKFTPVGTSKISDVVYPQISVAKADVSDDQKNVDGPAIGLIKPVVAVEGTGVIFEAPAANKVEGTGVIFEAPAANKVEGTGVIFEAPAANKPIMSEGPPSRGRRIPPTARISMQALKTGPRTPTEAIPMQPARETRKLPAAVPAPDVPPKRKRPLWPFYLGCALAAIFLVVPIIWLFYGQTENTPAQEQKMPAVATTAGWFGENMPPQMIRRSKIGEYLWQKDRSIMVYVPEGYFWHQSDEGQEMGKVLLPGYYIDKYELSNEQYQLFVDETGRVRTHNIDPQYLQSQQPVVGISWQEVSEYAAWTQKRLPTEMEWIKAARGGCDIPSVADAAIELRPNPFPRRRYPWGDDVPSSQQANYDSGDDGYSRPAPVDSFLEGASPYGCINMAGNVWEWCSGDDTGQKPSTLCLGGSWSSNPSKMFYRWYPKEKRSYNIGVRLVFSPK